MKKNLAASGLPPAEQEKILAAWKEAAKAVSPEFVEGVRKSREAERAEERASAARLTADLERSLPADPQTLLWRRLREFLEITGDVNFSAKTISLTGGTRVLAGAPPRTVRRYTRRQQKGLLSVLSAVGCRGEERWGDTFRSCCRFSPVRSPLR